MTREIGVEMVEVKGYTLCAIVEWGGKKNFYLESISSDWINFNWFKPDLKNVFDWIDFKKIFFFWFNWFKLTLIDLNQI